MLVCCASDPLALLALLPEQAEPGSLFRRSLFMRVETGTTFSQSPPPSEKTRTISLLPHLVTADSLRTVQDFASSGPSRPNPPHMGWLASSHFRCGPRRHPELPSPGACPIADTGCHTHNASINSADTSTSHAATELCTDRCVLTRTPGSRLLRVW